MRALVFGATGQTGSYLVERLAGAGHEVVAARRVPPYGQTLLPPVAPVLRWVWGDVTDPDEVTQVVRRWSPDVVFNLAALTTPGGTWEDRTPWQVAEVNAMGALAVIAAVEAHAPGARLIHASSAAVYRSRRYGLYGASKVLAHEAVKGARLRGLHATNAVLYSHTSPRQRGPFLLPEACRAAARIAAGSDERFILDGPGDTRDWMFAGDAAAAMLHMAHMPPGDYDVASGVRRTATDAVAVAFEAAGAPTDRIDLRTGGRAARWEDAADLTPMREAGWRAETSFQAMVAEMVAAAAADMQQEGP